MESLACGSGGRWRLLLLQSSFGIGPSSVARHCAGVRVVMVAVARRADLDVDGSLGFHRIYVLLCTSSYSLRTTIVHVVYTPVGSRESTHTRAGSAYCM